MDRVGLPDLANKNTLCLGKFEFQINNEQFLGKYVSPAVFFRNSNATGCPVFHLATLEERYASQNSWKDYVGN